MKKRLALVAFVLSALAIPVKAEVVSVVLSTVTTARKSPVLALQPTESLTWTLQGVGTGTVRIERSIDGVNYVTTGVQSVTVGPITATSGVLYNDNNPAYYRWNLVTTSTTPANAYAVTLTDNDDFIRAWQNKKGQDLVQHFDDGERVNGYLDATAPQPSTATTSGSVGSLAVKAYLGGSTAALEGSLLVATTPVSGKMAVIVAPATIDLTSWLGVAKAAASTGSLVDVYYSGFAFARTTGTVVPGDTLVSSGTVAGYLGADTTPTTGAAVGVAISNGIATGGLTKIRLR